MIVDLVKEFSFEAAHRLTQVALDHKCARLHGHSFKCEVAVRGEVDPATGWFIDYAEITEAFEPIRLQLDHYYLTKSKVSLMPQVRTWRGGYGKNSKD